jgi:aspartyl-tRNA(Asn)/glutamyl-tRNA(Gln) amidotransferase subunit C
MSLTADQIRQVAHLARLELQTEQVEKYARELSNILEMVGQLSASDTGSVQPMAHPLDMSQRLRPDAVTEADRRETFQAHAPKVQAGLYIVPKVIE